MTTAEKLLKVNEGIDKVEALNTELAQTLYGGDTGYRGYYDEFWEQFQQNGTRASYDYAFRGWRFEEIKPKYPINTSYLNSAFYDCKNLKSLPDINSSNINRETHSLYATFYGCLNIIEITFNIVPISSAVANYFNSTFYNCNSLKRIPKIVSRDIFTWSNTFYGCYELEELIIEGIIGQNGFNVKWSTKLSKASITSIINALSTTTSGLTVTLSKTAVESAFGSTTSAEWTNLIGTRTNWTISLA